MEASLAYYRELACGHLTTTETRDVYRVFDSRSGMWFCEICDVFTTVKART